MAKSLSFGSLLIASLLRKIFKGAVYRRLASRSVE